MTGKFVLCKASPFSKRLKTCIKTPYITFADDWNGTWGNPGKLGLSLIAMMYDSLFMTQHMLYAPTGAERRKFAEKNEFYQKLDELRTVVFPKKQKHLVYEL